MTPRVGRSVGCYPLPIAEGAFFVEKRIYSVSYKSGVTDVTVHLLSGVIRVAMSGGACAQL